MNDYCSCGQRRIERAFLSAGLVYCSTCDTPVCCDIVAVEVQAKPHAAEIANEEHFGCWRHWDQVRNLALSRSTPQNTGL